MSVQIDGSTGNIIAIKADYSGDVSIGGTLTYEDVTNIDSVGLITARNGIKVDDLGVQVGTGATIDGATNTLTFLTGGSERLRIDSNGGVLIGGHTSPVDSGNQPNIEIVNTSTSTLTLARNDTSIASGNDIAAIRVWGNDSNGTYQQCAEILAEADGDHGTGDKPTALAFKVTADGASSPTERLRVDSSGRLLLACTTPPNSGVNAGLQIQHTSTANITLARNDSSITEGNSLGRIDFYGNDGGTFEHCATIVAQADGAHADGDKPMRLTFGTSADGAAVPTERLRIDSSGRVLINHTTDIAPDGYESKLQLCDTSYQGSSVVLRRDQSNSSGPTVVLAKSRSSSKGGNTIVQDGDDCGSIRWYGNDGVDQSNEVCRIRGIVNGTPGSNDMPGALTFWTTPDGSNSTAERMRIDSGGNIGIGINNPGDYHADARDLVLASGMTIANATQGHIFFADSSTGTGEYVAQINYDHGNDRFNIVANNTTCIRIRSTGGFETYSTSTNIDLSNSRSAGSTYEFIYARHSATGLTNGTLSFKVTNNGNVSNTNNSYGSLSDQRLKENIVDATSQWDDIKGLQVRKYNFREGTGHETHTQLGLIAQEVESVSPGLVETSAVKEDETILDAEGNELDSIKSINYSVLYMKAVKALQEAQTRIETLETKVAALEG